MISINSNFEGNIHLMPLPLDVSPSVGNFLKALFVIFPAHIRLNSSADKILMTLFVFNEPVCLFGIRMAGAFRFMAPLSDLTNSVCVAIVLSPVDVVVLEAPVFTVFGKFEINCLPASDRINFRPLCNAELIIVLSASSTGNIDIPCFFRICRVGESSVLTVNQKYFIQYNLSFRSVIV